MSKEELLKFANQKKPADFTKEFKKELADRIQQKINNKVAEPSQEKEEPAKNGE